MRNLALTILKGLGVFVGAILALVLVLMLVFAFAPQIRVPHTLIEKGISYAPAEAKLKYGAIDIRFIKQSFNQKQLTFALRDVCIDYKEKAVDSCFDELSGAVSFKIFMPSLVKLYPLRLINAHAALDLNRLSSDEPKTEESNDSNLLETLRKDILPKWQFAGTKIELKKIAVVTGESHFQTSVFIDATEELATALALSVPSFKELNTGFPNAKLKYHLKWPTQVIGVYESVGEFKIQPNATQAIALNLETKSSSWSDIAYDLKAKVNGISLLNTVALNGRYTPASTDGLLSLQFGGPQSEIKQLNFLNCKYFVRLGEQLANLSCGPQQVRLALRERPTFKAKPAIYKLAPRFELKVTNLDYADGIKANINLDLDLEHLKFITAEINVDASIDGTGETFKYKATTDSNMRITDFKRLVRFLNDTPAAVPAPVNAMGGVVTLDIDGAVNEQNGRVNFAFRPDLSSQYQRLLFTLGGRVELENRTVGMYTKLVLNSDLQQVKLSLPRLELAAPPQLVPDGRFNLAQSKANEAKKAQPPTSGSTFGYDVEVSTPQVGSIEIATNLTKNPIPVGVDLQADSVGGVGPGEVEIGRVALELFRRKAFLEELNVELQPDGDKFLKGSISIDYLDYDISIRVAGTVESPQVIMESTPPLTQDQIISVLLFGKAPDELDEAQRSSVGNVSTAIADAALSFSSLYFLASTPVESVGYDAQRGVVTAKVGLGKGTSLELGSSGQEISEVGVRRRLGQNWYLNSYVEEDTQTDERSVAAFIEWVRRF